VWSAGVPVTSSAARTAMRVDRNGSTARVARSPVDRAVNSTIPRSTRGIVPTSVIPAAFANPR
jgi:hypothetical protein